MGWFSRTDNGFFIATVVPDNDAARVAKYLGVVHGEAIIGANIFRDMFSSVHDVVGGRAGGYERALSGARDAAVEDMIAAARELGADGVVVHHRAAGGEPDGRPAPRPRQRLCGQPVSPGRLAGRLQPR